MKNVLVQVAESFVCITACECAREQETKDKKLVTTSNTVIKEPYTFTSPLLIPVEPELLKENQSIWDDPKLLSDMVKTGLRQMNHAEVKDVILVVESFDLTSHEYQHIKASPKFLNNYAIEQIREYVGDSVVDYSVVYKDYAQVKVQGEETAAKAFALPKGLVNDLKKAFADNLLELIKIVPAEAGMISAATKTVYSFDRTVALVSIDYNAVRVVIAKNGKLLYCHDFHSPIEEIINIICEDRDLNIPAAVDYLRTIGYGFQDECRTATAQRQLEDIESNVIEEIVRNIRLVSLSLNIEIDQLYLSDFIAYIPHIKNYVVGMGIAKEIGFISDSFTPSDIIPEPSLQARDDFYKSGSFFFLNELMNSGTVYNDNLLYGLKASTQKNVDLGKKLVTVGTFVMVGVMVLVGGTYGFFAIREAIDNSTMADKKYDKAKSLIAKEEHITSALESQVSDAELLPRTKLCVDDVLTELNAQVVDKIASFDSYGITHTSTKSSEAFSIPISGSVDKFEDFIDLQNNIRADGYFTMSPSFSVSELNNDKSGYRFNSSITTNFNQVEQRKADLEAKKSKDK